MDIRKLATFTAEEEAQWKKAERVNDEGKLLFTSQSKWFRHSKYEIITHPAYKNMLCIVPGRGATIQWYNPFDEFPSILSDFIDILFKLESHKSPTILASIDEINEYKNRESDLFLQFVSNWGLLGHFWNYVETISLDPKQGATVSLKATAFSPDYKEIKEKINGKTVDYYEYASIFLPRLQKPYPIPVDGMGIEQFYKNYGEPIDYIVNDMRLINFARHLVLYKEFISGNYRFNDLFPGDKVCTWSKKLELGIDDIGMRLLYADCKQINWKYKSLLDALRIMYALNQTHQLGQEVRICKLSECNRPFVVPVGEKQLFCCKQHGDRARKRNQRYREKNIQE